uniref:DUF349 domain-containing protein n=1 Tax=Prevotella sp. TaxID=59823 RepID=UPI0040271374
MMDSQENALEQDKNLAQGATEGEQNAVQAQDENVENAKAATEAPAESSETEQQEASANKEQSAESQKQEDEPQTAEASEANQNGDSSTEQPVHKVYASKQEVLERIKEIARNEDKPDKDEVEHLKSSFYRFHIAEREKRQKDYLEAGGDPEKYQILPDDDEETFKAEMQIIKEKRAKAFQEHEAEKQANLQRKLDIIEKIKAMATSPEEANKNYNEFKELQKVFKEIKSVPPEKANEVWRNYQLYVEQFYDLLNLNREAREYDFKKNLEAKTKLCEEAEALDKEPDVISAFHQLQELHAQYREIGPVAKDLREQIWARFKAASTVINKKHQQHFEELRAKEEENLAKKTELCEKVEALAKEENKGIGDWEKHSKAIIALQQEWKTIGFAPQKMNVKIFERFRAACDDFFSRKSEFFKQLKQQFAVNAEKKRELIKKAQKLTDSTDWKATGDKFVALQKEWKTVGAVPKKLGDQLWNEFLTACNHFFDARNAAHAGTRTEEKANLQKKRDIIAQLKELAEQSVENAQDKVQELVDAYNAVGHVPFKEKDKIFKEYHDVLDKIYSDLHVSVARRRLDNFKQNLRNVAKRGEDAVDNERGRLARRYEQLKQEIATYENNLGFLNISSKKGNSLVDEMNRKVQRLKDDAELVRQKIKAIDSQDNN